MTEQTQSGRRTMEQERAAEAWGAIKQVIEGSVEQNQNWHNDYGTLVRGLPAMIHTNGLAATMAFLCAKEVGRNNEPKPQYTALIDHLNDRTKKYLHTDKKIMKFIREASSDEYRRATAELIAYSNWLKRYVEAKGWKSSSEDRT